MRLSRFRKAWKDAKIQVENDRIERYAQLIATSQLTGDFPEDMDVKEFNEIAVWDAIGRRSKQLIEENQMEQGVTALISLKDLEG